MRSMPGRALRRRMELFIVYPLRRWKNLGVQRLSPIPTNTRDDAAWESIMPRKARRCLCFTKSAFIMMAVTNATIQVKTRFGEFLDRVQREPVQVTRHERVVGVMVSAEDYAAMRAFYADRLTRTMDETPASAARAGLTPQELAALLRAGGD